MLIDNDKPWMKFITICFAPPREDGGGISDADLGLDDNDQDDEQDDGDDSDQGGDDTRDVRDDTRREPVGRKDENLEEAFFNKAGIDKDGKDATAKAKGKDGKQQDQDQRRQLSRGQDDRARGADHKGAKYLQQFARTHLTQDKAGNLIDPATKEIVAATGRERFYFEQARHGQGLTRKAQNALRQAVEIGQRLESENKAYQKANNTGLSLPDQTQAVQLYTMYKKDPLATLKYILTEAQANGIDLKSVLGANGGAIDTGAIASLIDKKLEPVLKPMNEQRVEQDRRNKIIADATRETAEFFERYPDAGVHEEELAKILTAKPHLKPIEIYFAYKEWAMKNDLDWSQPLPAQVLARQGNNGTRDRGRRQPLPQGREQRRLADNRQEDASFAANARTDDIVREAMRDAGISI